MRFDTRDTKPKLYGVLIQAVIVAAIVAALAGSGAQRHAAAIGALLAAFTLAVVAQLIVAFFRQIQYNPYSYNTIHYMGFALFLLPACALQGRVAVNLARFPAMYTPEEILHVLAGTAKTYMLLSFPFILVFSAALCASNLVLIRREGRRMVNVLGIVLSLLLLAGEVFLFRFDYYASGSRRQVMFHDLLGNLFAAVYLYFECMLFGTIVAGAIAAGHEPEPDKDFVIILGCALRGDGTPTPLLRGRLDRALSFAQRQKALTGKEPIFITSGGQGRDEAVPESAAMKRYLVERGVPPGRIVEEDRSANTLENMRFSREKILGINPKGKVAFATTNYHVFRSGLCARRVKMRAVGMGARTKWYFWPNAAVREFVGLLTEHRGKQALILGGMIAFYAVLTLLIYG